MKCLSRGFMVFGLVLSAGMFVASPAWAVFIGGADGNTVTATAGSTFSGMPATKLTDGSGMTPNNPVVITSTQDNVATNMWMSANNPTTEQKWVLFTFAQNVSLEDMVIWNFNQSGKAGRGLKDVVITYSTGTDADGEGYSYYSGALTMATGTNGQSYTNLLSASASDVKAVKITYTTNFDGLGYYGLSEVRFDGATAVLSSTWNGGGANDNWSTADNWGGTAPSAGHTLKFAGSTRLNNTNDLAANTTFAGLSFESGAGAFTLNGNAVALSGNVSNASANTQTINLGMALDLANYNIDAVTNDIVVNGAIVQAGAGTSGITKTGSGTLVLAGANTYAGNTTISAGTLRVGADGTIPFGSGKGDVVLNGGSLAAGTLDLNGHDLSINGLAGTDGAVVGQVVNNGAGLKTLTVGLDNDYTSYAGVLKDNSGSGGTLALYKTGEGHLTLDGSQANTYTGMTTVNAVDRGKLILSKSDNVTAIAGDLTIAYSAVYVSTIYSGVELDANEQIADTSTIYFTGTADSAFRTLGHTETVGGISCDNGFGVIENARSKQGLNVAGKLIVNSASDSSFNGRIHDGYLDQGENNEIALEKKGAATLTLIGDKIEYTGATTVTAGTLVLQDTTNLATDITNNAALVFSAATVDVTYSGVVTGGGALNKTGDHALTLAGANDYTGATTVSAGALLVTGSLGDSAVAVNGGTLGGTGTIGGPVTIAGLATLAPGASVGTLTIDDNLTLEAGALLDFELGAVGDSDLVSMASNTLYLNGQQFDDFTFTALEGFGVGVYTLIDAGSVSGALGENLSGTVGGLTGTLAIVGGDLVLNVVPEPNTMVLMTIGVIGLLAYAWRRRK